MPLTIYLSDEDFEYIEENREYFFNQYNCVKILWDKYYEARNNLNRKEQVDLADIFEDKTALQHNLETKPLWKEFFNKGENILLASEGGVGKSLLSIEIAKSANVEKALFLVLEDYSGKQIPRYIEGLDIDKFDLMTRTTWMNFYNKVRRSFEKKVDLEFMTKNIYREYGQLLERRERLLERYKIEEKVVLDNILVFEELMSFIGDSYDFICIDSLNELFGQASRINRDTLKRIISAKQSRDVTLLLLHHINKAGEITGSSDIVNTVDSAMTLERAKKTKKPDKDDSNVETFTLTEKKARFNHSHERIATIDRVRKNSFTAEHRISSIEAAENNTDSARDNLQNWIIDHIREYSENTVPLTYLKELLKDQTWTQDGFMNTLRKLEKANLIKRVGNREGEGKKTWDYIALADNSQDSE